MRTVVMHVHMACAGPMMSAFNGGWRRVVGLLGRTAHTSHLPPILRRFKPRGVAQRGPDASDGTWRAVVHPRRRLAEEQLEQPEWQLRGAGVRTLRALLIATGADGHGQGRGKAGARAGSIACGTCSRPAPPRRLAEAGRSGATKPGFLCRDRRGRRGVRAACAVNGVFRLCSAPLIRHASTDR